MPDNVTANSGSGGATFATDQRSGDSVHFPIQKIAWGALDTFNLTDSAAGMGLPVQPSPGAIFTVDSELAAAVVLSDNFSNPTVPMVGGLLFVWNGAAWDRLRVQNVRKDLNALSITSIATVWTPASGKKVRLMGAIISVSAAASVLFEDNSSGNTVCRTPKMAADTPYNFDFGQGILLSAANNVLKATASASATITGTLYGTEE